MWNTISISALSDSFWVAFQLHQANIVLPGLVYYICEADYPA